MDAEQRETSSSQSSTQTSAKYFNIEYVAQCTQLTKRTLRYYEEVGLLAPANRSEGNYRQYSEEDIQRIKRIKELRDLMGFSLNDIRQLLDAEDERNHIKAAYREEHDVQAKIVQLDRADDIILTQIALIEQKITGLQEMRSSLLARLEKHKKLKQDLRDKSI